MFIGMCIPPRIVYIMLFCALMPGNIVRAQSANFTGTWMLNKSKSALEARMWEKVESISIEIEQKDNDISIKSIMKSELGESSGSVDLIIGGDMVRQPGMGGNDVRIHGYWAENGRHLIVETSSRLKAPDGSSFETKITDTYSLARLGTILNLKREITTPNGAFISTLVFEAQY